MRRNKRIIVTGVSTSFISIAVSATIFIGSIAGAAAYYLYENKKQVEVEKTNKDNIFMNENGEYCCRFEAGDHTIKISRNDAYYHKIQPVEGYAIQEVEIAGWRDNNKVIYVNTEPVIAIGTKDKDGEISFNDFGKAETVNDINDEIKGGKTI